MGKYHMRKQERQITDENELNEILENGKYAVISMCRDNEPYIVTLSYGYDCDRKAMYFHTSPQGLKIDFIKNNPCVCATIIDDKGYKKDECAHEYRSVVVFGNMHIVEELREKIQGMDVLLNHLEQNPAPIKERNLKNAEMYNNIAVLRLDIKDISGKKGR